MKVFYSVALVLLLKEKLWILLPPLRACGLVVYLSKERHISAVVTMAISIVPAAVAQPEERGIRQVYGVQHNASNGKDSSSYVHEHSEAHLRGQMASIKKRSLTKRTHYHIYSTVLISFHLLMEFGELYLPSSWKGTVRPKWTWFQWQWTEERSAHTSCQWQSSRNHSVYLQYYQELFLLICVRQQYYVSRKNSF